MMIACQSFVIIKCIKIVTIHCTGVTVHSFLNRLGPLRTKKTQKKLNKYFNIIENTSRNIFWGILTMSEFRSISHSSGTDDVEYLVYDIEVFIQLLLRLVLSLIDLSNF